MAKEELDYDRLTRELDTEKLIEFSLPVERAGLIFGLLQMVLTHPDLEPSSSSYKRGRAFSYQLLDAICVHAPYFREFADRGWTQMFLATFEDEKKKEPLTNFSQLSPHRQYQLALLAKAFEVLATHTSELESLPGKEIREDAMLSAAAILSNNFEESVPEVIKELDENRFID